MKSPSKRRTAASADSETELAKLIRKWPTTSASARRGRCCHREGSAAVRKAQIDADDMEKFVDEYRAAIAEAQERPAKAQNAEWVETAASKLEVIADQMDRLAPENEKAAASWAASVKSMTAIMPPNMAVFPTFNMHRPGERPEGHAAYASRREAAGHRG